ncbi:MAG TPA: class I SAM-dependent methyltransferase family protein [Methanoregulaceae archaeon]|nr:class I SAM-dependent methyltransferase family protein [Methanoregulaceae archaeon]
MPKVWAAEMMSVGEREQWAVRVGRQDGEAERCRLLAAGLLDRTLRVRPDGVGHLLLPVLEPVEGAVRALFSPHAPRPELPRHELVGGIAILAEPDREAAERLRASRPSIRTVVAPIGHVEGPYRTRRFEVLAGEDSTVATVREHGLVFRVDLATVYFSARLSTERQRLLALVRPEERVLDMFAGAGPFALTLARVAGLVVAADINPAAVEAMVENCRANRVQNVLPLLADAARLPALFSRSFDRVVMNLPLSPVPFLPAAFSLCRPGGTIHLYHLQETEGEALPALAGYPVAKVSERRVRSYSPGRWHAVYDLQVGSEE